MDSIGAFEAKTNLSKLLERVANGETITITRHGVPVARLVPAVAETGSDASTVVDELIRYSKAQGRSLGPLTARDLIEEGRRR